MNLKTIGLVVLSLLVLAFIVQAATNNYTITRTTTAELSTGAWYDGFTVGSDKISLSSSEGRYQSTNFNVPNTTRFNLSTSGYSAADDTLVYGMVGSNTQWLNATDYRQILNPGHAAYSSRWMMTTPVATTSAIIKDSWFPNSGLSEGLVLSGNAAIVAGSTPAQNYLYLDGADDRGNANILPFNFRTTSWSAAYMYYPEATAASAYEMTIYNSSNTNTIRCTIGNYYTGGNYYRQVVIRDLAGTTYTYRDLAKPITLNQWHLCGVKCDSSNIYLYDNGVLQASGTIAGMSTGAGSTVNMVVLGGYMSSTALLGDWKGRLDDVSYSNGAITDTSNTSAAATYMWNDVRGITNTPASYYTIPAKYTGEQYLTIYGTGTFDIPDYSYTISNTKPNLIAVYPDGIDYPAEDVTLRVNASDADISYTSSLSATFYVDGVSKGTNIITTNGNIDKNIGTQTGGLHEWYALVYDPWGGTVLTDTYTFGVPAELYIRDEKNPDDLITGAEVQVSFYTENTSLTRTSTNGTISLYGLPTSDMLVSASADGYIARKTIIFSLYDTNSIYLLNESDDVIYQKFVLNTQTITGSPTDYILKIQKPMNGIVDTVFSSYFDFDGTCGTYLIESDVYQLVIVAPDGTESTYGYLYPDPDGQIDIAYEGLSFNEYVNAWIATNTTINKETKNINYGYAETEQSNSLNPISVTEATMVVTDESGNSVYNVTVTDSSYVFQYSAAADGRYTVDIEILGEDEDGNEFSYTKSFVVDFIDDHFQFMPDAYPGWLKMLIITFLSLLILVGFGGYRSDLACGLSFGLYAFSAYQKWISVGSLALGVMFIIVMAAFFKLQRKIKRGG